MRLCSPSTLNPPECKIPGRVQIPVRTASTLVHGKIRRLITYLYVIIPVRVRGIMVQQYQKEGTGAEVDAEIAS